MPSLSPGQDVPVEDSAATLRVLEQGQEKRRFAAMPLNPVSLAAGPTFKRCCGNSVFGGRFHLAHTAFSNLLQPALTQMVQHQR